MNKAANYITTAPPHLIPNLDEWPINVLSERRDDFVSRIVRETTADLLDSNTDVLSIVQNAIKLETRRIKNDAWSVDPPNQKSFWDSISKAARAIDKMPGNNSERKELEKEVIERIVKVYAEEIAGKFKPSMFRKARVFCNMFFSVLFNKFRTSRRGFWGKSKNIYDKIRVIGPVDRIRKLFGLGTIVFVPTHSSNLDSLLLGYAIDKYLGIPSSHYGAGLNLFNSEIAAYFMDRLGAYRVDRRKKNKIYLETLKSASRIAIELGVNSLFFPGGTRSRSGALEQNLKLGLMGTAIEAQRKLLENDRKGKVFIVPLIISYSAVLEDNSLFRNFLFNQGLATLVKKRLRKKNSFLKSLQIFREVFTDEMCNYLSFGDPLDVFGNIVDEKGRSLDKQGNHISKREYFINNGQLTRNQQREMQYTRILAQSISKSYREFNVIRIGQLAAASLYNGIKQATKTTSAEGALRLSESEWRIDRDQFMTNFHELKAKFMDMEAAGECIMETLFHDELSDNALIAKGVEQLRTYQVNDVIIISDDYVRTDHIGLLMYYANRLECYFEYERQL